MKHDILVWVPLLAVMLIEHFVLTRIYMKPSSLERLFIGRSNSAKTDWSVWLIYYFILPMVGTIAAYLTLPGLAFLGAKWLREHFEWTAPLGDLMPDNAILTIIIWLLTIDFAIYVSHILMHKVPQLWNYHRLHHAATEFNIITGSRVSLSENFFNDLVLFSVTLLILGLSAPEIALAVLLIRRTIDLLQHSDLPWDYGVLGYILASPRFHRSHHSCHKEDFDANYGNIFSFWDYIFNTAGARYRQSTKTADTCLLGLDDKEVTARLNGNWLGAPLQETIVQYLMSWPVVAKYTQIFWTKIQGRNTAAQKS